MCVRVRQSIVQITIAFMLSRYANPSSHVRPHKLSLVPLKGQECDTADVPPRVVWEHPTRVIHVERSQRLVCCGRALFSAFAVQSHARPARGCLCGMSTNSALCVCS